MISRINKILLIVSVLLAWSSSKAFAQNTEWWEPVSVWLNNGAAVNNPPRHERKDSGIDGKKVSAFVGTKEVFLLTTDLSTDEFEKMMYTIKQE